MCKKRLFVNPFITKEKCVFEKKTIHKFRCEASIAKGKGSYETTLSRRERVKLNLVFAKLFTWLTDNDGLFIY